MELLTFEIIPKTPFCFDLKGDSIFGHIVAYDYLEGGKLFDNYLKNPNLIVSDMMPFGYVYKPTLPFKCFSNCVREEDKKKLRKKNFIKLEDLQKGDLCKVEEVKFFSNELVVRNSINRLLFSTDESGFAPYSVEEKTIFKKLWMFCLVEESIKNRVIDLIKKIGEYGIGRDVSIGKGKFEVRVIEAEIKNIDTNYYLTISPMIVTSKKAWYDTFIRFGKYGLNRSFKNAFKKPVLFANSGAVIYSEEKLSFVGDSIENGIKGKKSYLQGYSILVPFKLKDDLCLK